MAVVASFALHALAWHLLPPIRTQIAPLARTLEVLLVAQPEAPPPLVEQARPTPAAQPAPIARKPRPVEATRQPPKVDPEMARESAPVAPPEYAPPASAPPRAEPAPPLLTRTPEPAPVAAPSADLLAGYGSSVSRMLARHREYPRIAAMRGWEGTVTMRLRVGATGRLLEAKVDSSSGHAVLDTQALEMVKRVPELPPPPEGLRDREFAVLVPVVFRLER
ncbi:MAG TPA: TonB family protein [Burkholderiales bacterium]|nr:TonB family protein [Burkholderiales bacterium]